MDSSLTELGEHSRMLFIPLGMETHTLTTMSPTPLHHFRVKAASTKQGTHVTQVSLIGTRVILLRVTDSEVHCYFLQNINVAGQEDCPPSNPDKLNLIIFYYVLAVFDESVG